MMTGKLFEDLVSLVETLRGENGCPWDREQTHSSLLPYFLEEAYEVVETVDQEDWETLSEELGDILLHVVFQTRIAEEEHHFKLDKVIRSINEKLVRRHPHVFGDKKAEGPKRARMRWETAKQKEKGRESRLDGVPKILPALVRSQRLQEKASYVGFDWERKDQVWQKVLEELEELKEAQSEGKGAAEEEMGDLLFALVNLCRFLNISAESALRKSSEKFFNRFKLVEKELKKKRKSVEDATLQEMEEIWNSLKKQEPRSKDQEPPHGRKLPSG
ncbi:MAG: nucleoside triphosphate pyrophosphohydrolase [Candidatus Neomarinimicrobiota bacterium]